MASRLKSHEATSDAIGNPTTYYLGGKAYTLTWEHGRQLAGIKTKTSGSAATIDSTSLNFRYDADGIRTEKSNGTGLSLTTHTYVTQNGKVIRETIKNRKSTQILDFLYDNTGKPFALKYSTDGGSSFTTYYYVLNLQGDVVALMDKDGAVIARYTYSAWGEIRSVTDGNGAAITSVSHIANLNPLRYRGYYYDTETGFYYLQSRYYDPITHRFINADSLASTGQGFLGYNMFAYCNNNPILFSDPSGCIIELSGSATEEEVGQYERAVGYIKTSETGAALIEKLESSSVVFTIIFIDDNNMRYEPSTGKIYFDPYSGLVMGDGTSVQSAALGLAHEMGHGAQHLDGELYGKQLAIENANVRKYETPIAKQLGEPVRSNYSDCVGVQRMNNSTHFKTTYRRPWWHYIAPWNWGRPSKVITEHNK